MKKETQRQYWTQEEVASAIAKAMEGEPEGPDKDYWTSELTVDQVKRKWHTTKFKPTPLKIVLVRQCCGEEFVHVLANKRKAKGLDDWRCPGLECRLRTTVLPFGKFEGQTLPYIYEQEPSYLAWFHETVDGCEEVKSLIRGLDGIDSHLAAFRRKQLWRQGRLSQEPVTPTQKEVEWLMGKFSSVTVDKVCEELFGGEG
jgi:hypothetical protein